MEISRFLRFAVRIAAALGKLHQRGLIHKDIKPANILANSATGAVWLTGFGIASRLPRERQSPEPPEVIAGTLAYMAPEQTGRMNRSIDSRSDLYSLGVTFYEMLTGVLPFNASDPIEWVHFHVARQPPPVSERLERIPEPISAIVSKLLAKTAEERYQTAAGVEADLSKCLTEWQSLERIEPFPLGAHDIPDRLLIPEKLYGRDAECAVLISAFDRVVASGIPELVLVSGYSGIGKSSIVNELHKVIVLPRGIFISGKFDQHKRDIPYATLGQAFQGLVRQILSKSEEEVGYWRDAIREAVGTNGQLMVNLIPELELVIGKQLPVPEIPPQDAQVRFDALLPRFLGAFARKQHPLALFLDDLQWLDPASLKLLEQLVTHPDIRHLLLIGAYRDNEVSAYHPLMLTLDLIRKTGTIAHEIVLQPLSLADVTQLIADGLRCEFAHAHPLAELVYEKTEGNPFFAIQFLTALAEERLLVFDASEVTWTWDVNRIRVKGFTDNVVDLMVAKLKRLPAATQEALKQFACLGNSAETRILSMVRGGSEEEVHMDLWEAVRGGLILRLGSSYKFLHDRVQEAAYALIPEEFCPQMHLRIARLLIAKMTRDEIAEKIFDVVHQLNSGLALISDPDEKEQVAELNLNAGIKAKASTAYASACTYLSVGMDLVGCNAWERRYELAFGLWLERAECEYLNGDFDRAERLIAELLARAVSKVDKAAAYRLKILLHILRAEYREALDSGLECLHLFGIEMPAHPTREQVQVEYETIWQNLGERSVEDLIDLPPMKDPEKQAAMRVLSEIRAPANMTDINLLYLTTFHMVNATLRYGTTDASTHGIVGLASILGPVFHRYIDGYHFGKLACSLVEKYGFHAYKAKAYLGMAHVLLWIQSIGAAIEFTRLAFRTGIETGDLSYASYSCEHLITDLLLQGVQLDEVWRESQKCLEFDRKVKFRDVADLIVSQQRFIQNMRGQTTTFSSFSDAQFDEGRFEAQLTADRMIRMVCYYWTLKLEARFISGDYDAARLAAQKAKSLLWSAKIHIHSVDYYFYNALTIAAIHETSGLQKQAEGFEELKQCLERLREWSETCPETFLDKYILVSAEVARIEHRDVDAMRLYEEAIRAARENGFVQDEGIANELAAQFCLKRGLEKFAHSYLREARYCFVRWGALGKVKQLDERYPGLAEQATVRPTTTIGTPVEQLDLGTVMKASQAVSGEIVLENLIKTLMMIAVGHAGAERGLLILPHGEEHRIEAEAKTGRDEVEVHLRQALVTPIELPESLLRYVIRTQESVILDDALVEKLFSEDEYVRQRRPRSVLCLPLVKQANLVGVLYLENTLAPRVFTPNRFAMLELLASQAAISLDHAQLYAELGRLNAELAKAKERLRLVVDTTPAMMQSALPDGSIDFFNRRWLEFFGLPLEEVRGWNWTSAVYPEDAPAFVEKWRMALKTGEGFEAEARCRRADGTYRWLFHRQVPLRDEGGNIIKWYGSSIDINDRKVAEEDLRRSEAFLAEAQRLSHTGSFGWNVSNDEHFWSDETFRIFEYDASIKVTSALILKRVHPQDIPLVQQIIELAADGKDFDYECRLLMPSGSVKHVRLVAHAVREESGNTEFIGAVMDVTAEKSSQQALKGAFQEVQALKNQFRLAIDTIPALVWTSLPDGHIDFFNQRWLEYTGLTLEKAGDWGWQAAIHPEDLAGLVDYWKSLLAFGKPGETEARMRRWDGEYRWFLLRTVPLYDGTGRIVKWYGTNTDIEERKQAENKFRRSEAFLAEGQRLSHTGGWGWNAASGELTWSQEHFRILGLDSERTRPSLEIFWERVHPEDRPGLMKAFDSAVRDKRDFEKEYRIVTPDGVVRHLHNVGHAVVNEANELVEFVGTTMDITDRKGAEEALRESEQRLQDIVDNTTAIIFVKDLELRYVLVNREYERLHHVQRDQIRGKTDFDILPHDVAEAVRDNDRRVIEAGVPIEFEQTVPWEDGERDYVVSKFLLHDHTEKPYAVCGVATDITELKRVGEMQAALARERELFAEQRAAEIAKANEALRGCLDALASVPELDEFIGQVMAAITRQLGADSSALRLLNSEKKAWVLELLSEDGRVMTPAEAKIPERWRSVSLDEPTVTAFLDRPMTVIRLLEPAPMREDWHSYLLALGVKAVVAIPLISAGQILGVLGLRFKEERDFSPEELEIARALGTQASLAIQLIRLARAARQSAVLEERNRMAGEIHDALAQSFTGISMQLAVAEEEMSANDGGSLSYVRRANEMAKFGLAEARRSVFNLRSGVVRGPGFVTALQRLVERSNVSGRLRCDFRSDRIPEQSLPGTVQHELLRIAQEALSNAVRHAKPTVVTVTLRWDPPNLILQVKDNGSGISSDRLEKSDGVGLGSMRDRATQIDATLEIQTAYGHGTSITVTVQIAS